MTLWGSLACNGLLCDNSALRIMVADTKKHNLKFHQSGLF